MKKFLVYDEPTFIIRAASFNSSNVRSIAPTKKVLGKENYKILTNTIISLIFEIISQVIFEIDTIKLYFYLKLTSFQHKSI